ncbi:MAG: folate-binding protein YgfZ [Geminicoccaceae bacterium]|nr:folate-binding protein YgfZ [Geminicoccaceae bacterium]
MKNGKGMAKEHLVHLADRALLRISGKDARAFLQGIVSNDVGALQPACPLYAALLTPQGKFLHDFILYEQDGGVILVDVAAEGRQDLVRRLTMYRLRAKVDIDEETRSCVLAMFPERRESMPEGFMAFADPRDPGLGLRLVGSDAMLPPSLDDPALYDLHRLKLGIPDGARDLVRERSTLAEADFERLNGVSFTKGCYVGQELTARMKHRGLAKRRLLPVIIDGESPACGTLLELDGKEVAEMRSSCDGYGMALVRIDGIKAIEDAGGVSWANGTIRLLHTVEPRG